MSQCVKTSVTDVAVVLQRVRLHENDYTKNNGIYHTGFFFTRLIWFPLTRGGPPA